MSELTYMRLLPYVHDDGGRAQAGYKGTADDCVTRAVAIAFDLDYQKVYDMINEHATRERPRGAKKRSSARTGVHKMTTRTLIEALGGEWHPTMGIGTGCRVHLRHGELPMGRLIVSVSKHLCAVIDGTIHDVGDPSRGGDRCVYGYFTVPPL